VTLDAAVREFLATKPDAGSAEDTIARRRALIRVGSDELFEAFSQPAGAVAVEQEYRLATSGVRLRVYRPSRAPDLPVHVFMHGGGFWLGSVDERIVDATCRERCLGAECVVVSVDYRLAPEHRFPVAIEDCYEALQCVAENAETIGADPSNISVGGVSAGANLAAALALATRDRGGPALVLQLLEVPPLDLTLQTMRSSGVGNDFGITVEEMQLSVDLYVRDQDAVRDPLASPLLAEDLRGLPPARILTAEFDPLRRDGELYAQRLREAGGASVHTRSPGAVHGSLALTASWAPARAWRQSVIDALRQAHDSSNQPHPGSPLPALQPMNPTGVLPAGEAQL